MKATDFLMTIWVNSISPAGYRIIRSNDYSTRVTPDTFGEGAISLTGEIPEGVLACVYTDDAEGVDLVAALNKAYNAVAHAVVFVPSESKTIAIYQLC